jgi:hypothetical protein
MQIYNNKDSNTKSNGRPKRSCSYCGDTEHVVTDCPNAVNDWAYFSRFEIPLKQANHWTLNAYTNWNGVKVDHWYRQPREWGRWFEACETAIGKISRAKIKAQAKQSGRKRAPKCGFCGSTDHNRRDCGAMKQFKQRLLEANRDWRQRFYDKLVGELGLSVGAVVNVKVPISWKETEEKIGIIESINWDELSMFCYTLQENGWRNGLRDEFRQDLEVMVNVEGVTRKLKFGGGKTHSHGSTDYSLKDDFGTLTDYFRYTRDEAVFVSTIARSETPLDEEWVNQGHEDAMDFLIKKYSLEKLKGWHVQDLLSKVEEANNQKKLKLSA